MEKLRALSENERALPKCGRRETRTWSGGTAA